MFETPSTALAQGGTFLAGISICSSPGQGVAVASQVLCTSTTLNKRKNMKFCGKTAVKFFHPSFRPSSVLITFLLSGIRYMYNRARAFACQHKNLTNQKAFSSIILIQLSDFISLLPINVSTIMSVFLCVAKSKNVIYYSEKNTFTHQEDHGIYVSRRGQS